MQTGTRRAVIIAFFILLLAVVAVSLALAIGKHNKTYAGAQWVRLEVRP